MDDILSDAAQILSNPTVWRKLLQSGFFLVDYENHLCTPSRVLEGLGYVGTDFLREDFLQQIHPADRPTYSSLWSRVTDGRESEFFSEYRIRTKKGSYRWVQTSCLVLERDGQGCIVRLLGMDKDIGLRKQSESLLHSRFLDLERRLHMSETLRIAGSRVTASLDIESTIPVILEQAQTLFSFTGARVWAYSANGLELLGQEEDQGHTTGYSPATSSLVLKVAGDKTPMIVDNLASRLRDQPAQASWIGIPLLFHGEARGVMEFWHEESGFFRSEHVWPAVAFADNVAVGLFNANQFRATQEAGETDALTGLATRHRLERLGPKVFQAAVDQVEDLAVFMVDIDHFKAINDTFGHGQGDLVLRSFAQTCQSVLRKGDLMCRYGGDEFVALLPNTNEESALAVGQRIIDLFKMLEFPFQGRSVTLSIGVGTLRDSRARDLKELLEAADLALYRVKSRGRDGISA